VHPSGWFARLDALALDSFYYYTSDAQTSKSYHLENLRAGYHCRAWTASLWVRNLFNERYAQQGFNFGLISKFTHSVIPGPGRSTSGRHHRQLRSGS
jgi:outer membrane receptor protein involved in Fe transport